MIARGGLWLMTLASAAGLAAALFAYLHRGSGIDHTGGAMLVIVSTALLAAAGLVLIFAPGPGWLRALLLGLSLAGVLGTAVAAFFLHAWLLLALMIAALIGWLAKALPGGGEARIRAARP